MRELTTGQRNLLSFVDELQHDPVRRGLSHRQVLMSLRTRDHQRDEAGNSGTTLAQRWGMAEGQVDELLELLADEPASAPVSPAPAGPRRETPMPATAASWDTSCTGTTFRVGQPSCLHAVAVGWINPPELCPGCTRRFMDALDGAVAGLHWHPTYYQRAGVEAPVEGGDGRG